MQSEANVIQMLHVEKVLHQEMSIIETLRTLLKFEKPLETTKDFIELQGNFVQSRSAIFAISS